MSIQVPLGQPVEKHLQYLGCLRYELVTIYVILLPDNLLAETRKQTQSVEVFERRRERKKAGIAWEEQSLSAHIHSHLTCQC